MNPALRASFEACAALAECVLPQAPPDPHDEAAPGEAAQETEVAAPAAS